MGKKSLNEEIDYFTSGENLGKPEKNVRGLE